MEQEFTSKETSINKDKVPAIFKKINWVAGTDNLDYGGGKYDTATEYLKAFNVDNAIYDPYNRDIKHNLNVMRFMYDTATISNVLNVIKEKEVRVAVVKDCLARVITNGIVYIKVYEGNRSGVGKQTKKSCWQTNMRTKDYLEELKEFNPIVKNGMIIITK